MEKDHNEEYKRGYRDGFQDGYGSAVKQYPNNPYPSYPSFPDESRNIKQCKLCGMVFELIMHYTCSRAGCPTFPIVSFTSNTYGKE